MKRRVVFIWIIIVIMFSNISYAYINIYPTKFNKNISNGATEIFYLYNRSNNPVKYRIYLDKEKENDMTDWIEIYPKSITLKPLEQKEFKIFVNPPKNIKDGIYQSKLVVKQVSIPKINEKNSNFMTILKMKLKGYIGETIDEIKKV